MKTRVSREFSTNGYSTAYAYDAAGNLTNVTYSAGTASITNGFDALNRLTNRLDAVGQSRYTYTVLGNGQRTFAEDGPWASDDVTVTNRYGLRAGLTLVQPTGQFVVTNAWDASRRWSVVGGPAGTFTYDYAGSAGVQPAALTLPGGGYLTNTYDTLARLTRTELRTSGGAILNSHSYLLNAAHQRTLLGRTNSAVASWNGYVLAAYDAAGQLTNAWTYQPNGTPVTAEQWSYGYDAAQNLSKRTNYTTVETFTVNALNQLTAVPDSTPTYDRRGNLTQRYFPGGPQYYWTYTYDAENQLASVATDTYYTAEAYRFKVEFTYDGQGRLRVRKDYTWSAGAWVLGTETRYVYDGMLLVQERNGSNTPTVTYTRGRDLSGSYAGAGGIGGLLARSHGYSAGSWSTHNFYHADGNGNVTALVNSAGTLQASYKYDPYGRYLGGSGSLTSANVMRFSSKPWVGFNGSLTAGLYSYGYRFYDPYLQRWLNRDPVGEIGFENLRRRRGSVQSDGFNLYLFVRNNPMSLIDRLGLQMVGPPGSGLPSWGTPPANPCPCGETIAQIAAVGPFDANTARRLANQARAAADASGLPGRHNGPQDAFRHCLWSCLMAQELGPDQAKEVGDTHERCATNNPSSEEAMDLANNAAGRQLGTPGTDCHDACMQAVHDGTLRIIPGGSPPIIPY